MKGEGARAATACGYVMGVHWARKLWGSLRRIVRRRMLKRQTLVRPLRIVLGSGGVPVSGWILTDVEQLNILSEHDWARYFKPNTVDAILAEHVWEHLSAEEGLVAARLCLRYLRIGGYLRIAVPDGLHPDAEYVASVRPGGSGHGADDHKVLYTWRALHTMLQEAGFQPIPLEYFDETGRFMTVQWDADKGMVRRSARFDDRNKDGILRYTSIIFDAVKPAEGA